MSPQPERIYQSPPHMTGHEQRYLADAFATNWIAPAGPHLQLFEKAVAERVECEHAVAVASGTAALHLALRLLDLEPGDEVLCSTLTFCASANVICYEQGRPVFIDSERTSWNLDPNLLAEELAACDRRGRLPRAVIAVDILGQSCDIGPILEVCSRYEIPVIEDAAGALGATYGKRPVGASSHITAFSFNGNKIITTSGGGMLTSNDGKLIERARYLSTQARQPQPYFEHTEVGYNYRLSNVLAAIGLGQLEVLDDFIAARGRTRELYRRLLADVPGVRVLDDAPFGRANNWISSILIDPEVYGCAPDELRLRLEEENIEARLGWKPMHLQPVFQGCRQRGGEVAEWFYGHALILPSGTALTEEQVRRVTDCIVATSRSAASAR